MVKLVNRAKMTTATTGTGTLTLGSAVDGFQTFAAAGVSNGETVRYCIEDGTSNFELGAGVYTHSGTTLTRVVSESSNSGNAINLSGDAIVFITAIAADLQPTTFTTSVFTATANQTTFTVSYTVGFVEVFLNGAKLSAADFTATNGTSIVLASGATVGDTLDVVAYGTQTIANVYTQTQSDARYLQLTGGTLTGDLTGTTGSFSGDLTIADKIVHSGDTNTAIRFPAVDTFSVETDGNERIRVGSSGQIGIGGANYGTTGQVLTSGGASGAISWADAAGGAEVVRVARTSDTALTSANSGNLIDITSGTFTQTFNASSSLASGWFVYIRNSGTGDITLDPNSSETIDGLTSFLMYPGEVRLVQCDGSNLHTIVLSSFRRSFTSNGTFTRPPGYRSFTVELFGGGGGGGSGRKQSGSLNSGGAGGGGAARINSDIDFASMPASVTVTVGAGGSGGTGPTSDGSSNNGSAGGATTFGTFFSAPGGNGGAGGKNNAQANGGSKGESPQTGGDGVQGGNGNVDANGSAGEVTFGGGAGGGAGGGHTAGSQRNGGTGGTRTGTSTTSGAAAGSGNGGSTDGGDGTAATLLGYGGGGGGAAYNGNGGDGGNGAVAGGGGGGGSCYAFSLGSIKAGDGGDGGSGVANIVGVV